MIYDKLSIVLLTTIMSEPQGSINSIIASYIIEHLDSLKDMTITELASQIHVANSSISRFAKDVGLKNYNELRTLIKESHFQCQDIYEDYQKSLIKEIEYMKDISYDSIHRLVKDIRNYKKIGIFGLLKAECAALSLQCDLVQLSKYTYTNMNVREQMDYILNSDKDTLIILFSYTGAYFENVDLRREYKKLYTPKIWMISSSKSHYDCIDDYILFSSHQSLIGHPYQLEIIAGMIAQEYQKTK